MSSLNVQAGQIVANAGVVAVSAADSLCVTANAATDVVLDVTGWYGPGGGDSTSVQTPTRLVDTRSGAGRRRVRPPAARSPSPSPARRRRRPR